MLSETSFGETKWIGPMKIVQILPHKIRVQFNNGEVRWIKNIKMLRPLEDFLKQGEGYVLKSANSDEIANSDPTTATNAPMPISQSEQTYQALIRMTQPRPGN